MVQKGGDCLSDADGGEDTGAEQGVATKSIVENILWSGDIGMTNQTIDRE